MDFQASSNAYQPNPEAAPAAGSPAARGANTQIGTVLDISGSSSRVILDNAAVQSLGTASDPSLASAGQVGCQIKVKVGSTWLVANVRTLSKHPEQAGKVIAMIDFLGEGMIRQEDRRLRMFRRGVTRYPVPGSRIFPVDGEKVEP